MITAAQIPECPPDEVLAETARAGRAAQRLAARGLLPHFELDPVTGTLSITLDGAELDAVTALALSGRAAPARS